MRLRLFRARSMSEAMTLVRGELGGEALILSSRRVPGGVELTAGLDTPEAAPPLDHPAPRPVQPGPARRPGQASEREALLAWHGVPETLRGRLAAGPLPFALSAALRFAKLPVQPGCAPLLLAGPPGAGKTLTVARLATRLVLAGQRPLLLAADARRAGATEQLAAFTRVLGLDLLLAAQPGAVQQAQARAADGASVLVDCHGTDAFASAELAALGDLAASLGATVAVVLPAGMDAAESADLAQAWQGVPAALLVATRLDIARRLGGILAAAGAGLKLAEFGIGPGAADGLVPATPALLAQRLAVSPAPLPLHAEALA